MLFVRVTFGIAIAMAIPLIPTVYASQRLTSWRHFHVVEEGHLYRSGQLTPDVLDRVIHDHKIKIIVCLRNLAREGDNRLENSEELWCAARGIDYVRLNPADWNTEGGRANLEAFLHTVKNSRDGAILIHCFAGLHRTGVYCAIFRMECEGWSNDEAIAEMYAIGYFQEDPSALQFLRSYVPRGARFARR